MKLTSFFISCFFINSVSAQLVSNVSWIEQSSLPASQAIYYNPNKNLTWDDFMSKPPADNSFVAAMTVSGFGYNANVKTVNGTGELNVSVYCYFNKGKSWVKPGKNTSYILNHEQHHFDVSYIAAAIFMDKLQSTKFTPGNYKELLPRIYNECCDIMNKMQNDYDKQTKNGQVKDEQSRWNALIDSKVNALTR